MFGHCIVDCRALKSITPKQCLAGLYGPWCQTLSPSRENLNRPLYSKPGRSFPSPLGELSLICKFVSTTVLRFFFRACRDFFAVRIIIGTNRLLGQLRIDLLGVPRAQLFQHLGLAQQIAAAAG